jgi:tetratricopeptide (TPR) repeat protein
MYHKFINSDDKDIIDGIMADTENYHEFVSRLGEHITDNDVSSELAHIAIVHAWELRETSVIDKIASRYSNNPFVKPWTYPIRTTSDRLSSSHHIQDAVELAMYDNPANWIEMNLLLLKSYALLHTPQGPMALDDAKTLLETASDLSCYRPYIHHIEGRLIYAQEGNPTKVIPICQTGLELALEDDNLYQVVWLYRWLGMVTMNMDPHLASEHLEEAYRIAKGLGTPFHTAQVLLEMGWDSVILGEYDLALAFYDEARTLVVSMDEISDRHAMTLTSICSDLNDAQQALDWAKWALEWHMNHGSEGDSWIHSSMARALVQLGRLDEAEERLDVSRELAFKSGQEREIALFYLVSGIHETFSGEPATAIETLRSALEIYERTETQEYINRTLLALVRAEIEFFKLEGGDETSDSTGQWMTYLEDTARSKNFPGILIQHSILKADFHLAQGRVGDARTTLIQALDIHDSPGVRSLQKQILEKIRVIDTKTKKSKPRIKAKHKNQS